MFIVHLTIKLTCNHKHLQSNKKRDRFRQTQSQDTQIIKTKGKPRIEIFKIESRIKYRF